MSTATDVMKMEGVKGPVNDLAQTAYKKRLRLVNLVAKHSGVRETAGLSKMTLEYETTADPAAVIDMSGERRHPDKPLFRPEGTPLPMTHSDVKRPVPGTKDAWEWVPRAEVDAHPEAVEAPARRVGELVERTFVEAVLNSRGAARVPNALAVETGEPYMDGEGKSLGEYQYFRAGVYEMVERMVEAARATNFYGPFAVLCGTLFDVGLDTEEDATRRTLRQAVLDIGLGPAKSDDRLIVAVKRLEMGMPDDALVLLQLTPGVVRVIDGMPLRVVPWEDGYKVVTITCPQVRTDFYGKAGVVIAVRETK